MGSLEALALPRRYHATINLLKTHDKLARTRGLVGARLGSLPSRYPPAPLGLGGREVPTSKRILSWDLSAWKLEPLIEAETVITLLYHIQAVAPQVLSDLITRTSSATNQQDLANAVTAWAVGWRLCGLTGPPGWALLIGLASARSMPIPFRPLRDLPNDHYLALPPVVDQATAQRLTSAEGRVLVDIETAKAVVSGWVTPVPHRPHLVLGDFGRSGSDHVDAYVPARWYLTFYRRAIRKRIAALNPGDLRGARRLRITVEFPETDPVANDLMKGITRLLEDQVLQHADAGSQPTRSRRSSADESEQVSNVIWFIRYQILLESLSEISRTANKFIRNDSADHPRTCDRGTVERRVRDFAEKLGIVLRCPGRGGRPIGKKDAQLRNRPSKNR